MIFLGGHHGPGGRVLLGGGNPLSLARKGGSFPQAPHPLPNALYSGETHGKRGRRQIERYVALLGPENEKRTLRRPFFIGCERGMRGKWTIGVFAAVTKSLRKAEAWKCSILLDDTAKRGRYLGQIARLGHIILGIDAEVRGCPAYTLLYQFSPKDTGQSKVK